MIAGLPRIGQVGVRGAPKTILSQAIALLQSVGGRMYLPGLTSMVASDGSGAVPVAGDVIGWLPDRVSGGLGVGLLPTFDFRTWVPINTPINITQNSFQTTGGAGVRLASALTVGKQYSATVIFTTTSTGLALFADSSKGNLTSGVPLVFTSDGTGFLYLRASSAGVTAVSSIVVREVLSATQSTTGFKPKLSQSGNLYSLEFDGVDDVMTGTCPVPNNSDFTMVVAMNQLAVKRNAGVMIYGGTSYASLGFDGGTVVDFVIRTNDASSYPMQATETSIGVQKVLTGVKSGANCTFWANGVQKSTATLASTAQTFTGTKIGQSFDNTYANTDIAFIAIAPIALTMEQIQILERAAAQAAGITL